MFGNFVFALFSVLVCIHGAWGQSFNIGDRVVTDKHNHGTVAANHPNATVAIDFGAGIINDWPINRVTLMPTNTNGFYPHERVVTDKHHVGTIESVYPDGTVDIRFDTGSINNWPTNRICRTNGQ